MISLLYQNDIIKIGGDFSLKDKKNKIPILLRLNNESMLTDIENIKKEYGFSTRNSAILLILKKGIEVLKK